MGRVSRWWLATAVAVAPMVACSLLVDTSGLSNGPQSGVEGGIATPEASIADADASSADGPRIDGVAPTCGEAGTTFCDDFERSDVTTRWDSTRNTGGALEATPGGVGSATAFRARSSGGQGDQFVYLEKSLPIGTRNVRCEFDLRADPVPAAAADREVEYFVLRLARGTSSPYLLYFNVYARDGQAKWNVGEYISGSLDRSVAFPPITDRWVHVVVDVANRVVSVSVDGILAGTLADLAQVDPTSTELHLGVAYATTGIATTALFDNLACRFGL